MFGRFIAFQNAPRTLSLAQRINRPHVSANKMMLSLKPARPGLVLAAPWLSRARPAFSNPSTFGALSRVLARDDPKTKMGLLGAGVGAIGVAGLFTYGMTSAASSDSYPKHVRQRLMATYGYMTAGLATTAVSAAAFWRSGLALRMAPMPRSEEHTSELQ